MDSLVNIVTYIQHIIFIFLEIKIFLKQSYHC